MDMIRVDTGRLRSAAEAALSALEGAEKNTEAIRSAGARLGLMWEGEAESSFRAMLEEDIAMVSELCSSIRSIAEFETEAASSYEECEMKVMEEAASI